MCRCLGRRYRFSRMPVRSTRRVTWFRFSDWPPVASGAEFGSDCQGPASVRVTGCGGRYVVVHGFRNTFTDWVADNTDVSVEVGEAALAHAPESDTRKAYRRNDMLKPRRPLMQQWADYVLPVGCS